MSKRLLIAGLTVFAAMTAGDASAQECSGWSPWACSGGTSSSAAAKDDAQQGQQPLAAGAAKVKPQATDARQTKVVRHARRGEERHSRREQRQEASTCGALSEREKASLFRDIVAWQNERQENAATDR